MRAHRVLGCLLFGGCVWAQQYVISTIAGGAPPPTPAVAKSASIGDPTRLATDAAGDVHFGSLHSVFKVDAGGTLTRVAGNGRPGNSGDGGPAAAAQLSFPMGLAADTAGNLFVADRDASVVRRIAANGIITTVAGSGVPGFAGDGGAATSAQINGPYGVAVGAGGDLYIADTLNGRIRRVGTDGVIDTVAGVGSTGIYSGDGGPARNADISLPTDVALDGAGTLYLADFGNTRVRMVSGGIITTVAGQTNGAPLTEGQAAVNVRLEGPTGLTVDSGGGFFFLGGGNGGGYRPGGGRLQSLEGLHGGHHRHAGGERHPELLGRGSGSDGGPAQRAGRSGGLKVRRHLHFGYAESAGARHIDGGRLRAGHTGGQRYAGLQRRDHPAARRAAQRSGRGGGG